MKDKEWYVERKRGEGIGANVHHKGLMPRCYNCDQAYKLEKSDDDDFLFMATHPKNKCPFKEEFYGNTDIECIAKARDHIEEKWAKKIEATEV
jgi:hypothetical protein